MYESDLLTFINKLNSLIEKTFTLDSDQVEPFFSETGQIKCFKLRPKVCLHAPDFKQAMI
jgi:hypothetical protein